MKVHVHLQDKNETYSKTWDFARVPIIGERICVEAQTIEYEVTLVMHRVSEGDGGMVEVYANKVESKARMAP